MRNEPFDRVSATASAAIEESRLEFVRRTRAEREHRIEIFGPVIARELPWDILLVLYVNHEQIRVNVSSIHADVGAAPTTVLRWLDRLEAKGFIERWPSSTDQRVTYISLSPAGKCTLDLYFDAILAATSNAS